MILASKSVEKKTRFKRWHKLKDRIQMDFKEMYCEKVNCVEVAKNLAVNNMSMDLKSRVTISQQRRQDLGPNVTN
jgi:hypothetical protein